MTFALGLLLGVALGVLAVAAFAIAAYDRGYEDSESERRLWRARLASHELRGVS